jgi:hypothetical protein
LVEQTSVQVNDFEKVPFGSPFYQKKLADFSKSQEISKVFFLETPLPKKQMKFFEGFLP